MHFYRGSGAGAARYFDEGHQGAEAYYTERARVAVEIDTWTAGERSGTTVLAEPGDLVKWVEGVDPASGEVKGIIRSGGEDRQPLRFVEVVVNNPKSLSIVASQNPAVAAALDRTLGRQADEIARYLSSVAVTRIGPRGAQQEVGGLTVETARVAHLTSREGDPHRHVHLMLNTRVKTPDGAWHGLHSASIRQHIRAVNERAGRVLLSDVELRATLAEEGYTLGADGEIDQARRAVGLLSKRSVQTAANRVRVEAEWRAAYPGREPSQRVRNGWDQQAWAEGRPTKPGERETPAEMSERVRVELAGAGFDFTPGAHEHDRSGLDPAAVVPSVAQVDRDAVAAEAVAVLSGQKSSWSQAELTAMVEAAVTRTGVVGYPQAVGELVEDVRARAAGRCRSVLDPEVHTPTSMSRYLTSPQVIDADMRLNLGLTGLAGGDGGGRDEEAGRVGVAQGLDDGQVEAVEAVCGGRRLEVVVGPAGTGKTRMLAAANQRLEGKGRDMIVVAPTRKAAQVAAAEIGVGDGSSLSKLVYDHGFRWNFLGQWSRLEVGQVDPRTGRTYQGPAETAPRLSERSVVVVDEAGLLTVDQANALVDVAAESGAAIRLVGDPRQLGAVGRGGVMETASRWVEGGPVTLDRIHRFLAVTVGEDGLPVTGPDVAYGELSKGLREGVAPEAVAERLTARGAVIVHGSEAEAVAAIAVEVAFQGGRDGDVLAVTVATNQDAAKVNEAVRGLRVTAGEVDDTRVATGMDGVRVGVGDRIVTRRNDTTRGVANREAWTVETVTEAGTVLARSNSGGRRVRLDGGYVAGAVQLGYAVTDYGNQGVTADRSVTWVTDATTAGGLYVGATRGRYANALHVVADDPEDAKQRLAAGMGRDRADRGLDAARARAETEAATVTGPAVEKRRAGRRVRGPFDLLYSRPGWRSPGELDAAAKAVEVRHARQMRTLREIPVMDDTVRERENQADRTAAAEARIRAGASRVEAERIATSRPQLAETATVDYYQARDDARIIAAGPGRLGRRAAKVEAAEARRAATGRRWGDSQLPNVDWPDRTVRYAAESAVERTVTPAVRRHNDQAAREEQTAVDLDRQVTSRDREQAAARATNQRNIPKREAVIAATDRDLARIAHDRAVRAEQAETMTPEQIAGADHERDEVANIQARVRQTVQTGRQIGPARPAPEHDFYGPRIGRDGPGLER
jgi:exodeoxyribonuclease V alpha subunit